MKQPEEIMEILEAYDLTDSYRAAAELAGCGHHTVPGTWRCGGGRPKSGADARRAGGRPVPGEDRGVTELLATRRGLASALHSGDPAFEGCPAVSCSGSAPPVAVLLDAAVADGAVRDDISAEDLLHAITQLCQPVPGQASEHNQRIVAVLLDGLRYGATQQPPTR